MANVNVSKTDFQVSVNASTNEVTVTSTPTTLVIQSEAYSPVSSVNAKTGAVVLTTTDIAEGTNLYYTPGRFDTRLATKTTSDLAEGTNLYYTTDRFDTRLATKSINVLSDVNTTTAPTNGQSLIWNSSTSQWIPGDGTAFTTQEVNVTPANTENNNFYVPFVRENSGSEPILSDTGLTYNPNTNTLGSATPINISGNATSATYVNIVQSAVDSVEREVLFRLDTSVAYDQDDQITYNPNLGRLSVANLTVSGTISGTVTNATNAGYATNAGSAANVTATALNSFASTVYPLFATSASGSIGPGTDTGLTYVPSTNTLTTDTFVGALTGNASTATTATNANNVAITTTTPTTTHFIPFVNGDNGNQVVRASSSLYINGITDELYTSHKVKSTEGFYGTLYGSVQATNDGGVIFYEATGNGSNYVTLSAASAMSANYDLNLPASQGSAGTVLTNDGSGNLSWGTNLPTDGRNLTYTSTTLDLDKNLTEVNSVASDTANQLELTGTQLLIKTRVSGDDDSSLVIYSQGYTDDGYMTGAFGASTPIVTVSGGSVTTVNKLRRFNFAGSISSGSNTVTITEAFDDLGTPIADLTSYINDFIGQDIFDDPSGNTSELNVAYLSFPKGTTVTNAVIGSPTSTATLTVSNNALRSLTFDGTPTGFGGTGSMYTSFIARNSANSVRLSISGLDPNTGLETTSVQSVIILKESTSGVNGFRSFNYLQPTVFTVTFATNPVIRYLPRKRTELRGPNFDATVSRANEVINIPRSIGIGPNAVNTAHGAPDEAIDLIGLSLSNDGSIAGNTNRLALNITQFRDNSYYSGFNYKDKQFIERSGPYLQFNQFTGNAASTTLSDRYATAGDGLGHVAFYAQPNIANYSSLSRNPASINVRASETMSTSTRQGTGMSLQSTPNNIGNGAPRTFLVAEGNQSELRALSRVQLKPYLRAVTIATNAASFNSSTLQLTLTYTVARTNVPYVLGQTVTLSGFSGGTNTNYAWNVVSATTTEVVLESSNANVTSGYTVPTTFGNITTSANGRAAFNPGQPHFWLEASDYTHSGSHTAEGTGTLVKIAADNNNGDVGLVLRRTVGNTANFELKLPTGTADTLQLVNNGNSTTPVTIDNSKVAFTVPVQFPVYTKAAAGAITGSVGMQICISDSAGGSNPNGMMAFWDTTNSRWSYVHDNNAL